MEIIIAKTAGFCFGVDRAVNKVNELVQKSTEPIYTLGPIIHNEQVVNQLKEKGVKVVEEASEINIPGNVVIRAHGVTPDVYRDIEISGFKVIDATCPYVKKIHNLVEKMYKEGYRIVIVGDKEHPEVKGINGWCDNSAYIVNSIEDTELIDRNIDKLCVVAQTTITNDKWVAINKYLEKFFHNIIKFDTICNATSRRQEEASQIARNVDAMLIVGGKNSSNTQKLYEICSKYCPKTYKIEMPGDIPLEDIKDLNKIGVTAGASTPDWVIKEVIEKMSDINTQENEMSFKEAFESSLVTLRTGEIVKGRIIGFNNSEVYVDMGFKSDGIIPMEEFTDDPDFNPEEALKVGEEVEALVVRVSDSEGNVKLSKKRVDEIKSWDRIEDAYKSKTPVKAKVTDVVNGGVIANAGGVRVFVPASQISNRFVKELNEFLKQTVNLRIVEFNKQKKKIVGSQRVILEEVRDSKEKEIWGNIEPGKKYAGVVKSFTDFGAFVDIGGVDGLIHISELSWTKVKHPSDVLKIGEKVEVTVLEADKEKKRISLGYRKVEDNPWHNIEQKYKVGDIVKGKVARLVPFGAFIELEKGVDGLVHISQISNVRIAKPGDVLEIGQVVEAKVLELNVEAKKISLSIKEVKAIDPVDSSKPENGEAAVENAEPSEHTEEMGVTIGDLAVGSEENKNA